MYSVVNSSTVARFAIIFCLLTVSEEEVAFGVDINMGWLRSITSIITGPDLPIEAKKVTLFPSVHTLTERVIRSSKDPTIESVQLSFKQPIQLDNQIVRDIARPGMRNKLQHWVSQQIISQTNLSETNKQRVKVVLTKDSLKLLNLMEVSKKFPSMHHKLRLDPQKMKKHEKSDLLTQVQPYFPKRHMNKIRSALSQHKKIDVEHLLLPSFAKRMVRRHVLHRGPNCFHASIAFHSPIMAHSALVNVKKEVGYHRSMINYDELWRILTRSFYEVNPTRSTLKYGDIIVFLEPSSETASQIDDVNFRWIRHASVYLFSNYTFSKGSKSPNTAYTIKTLDHEWQTWNRITTKTSLKVFRRAVKNVKRHPPNDLTDWIY